MEVVGIIVYMALGYWAVGQTIYKGKILIGTLRNIFLEKLALGFFLGIVLIPLAIILYLVRSCHQ